MQCLLVVQAHGEQVRQLQTNLSLHSDRLNSLETEAGDLRRQLSSLRATLAEEEASHKQARMVSHLTPCSSLSITPSHRLLLPKASSLPLPAASQAKQLAVACTFYACLYCCIPSTACCSHKPVPAPVICWTIRNFSLYIFISFHFVTYSLGCGASCDSSDILA